MLVSLLQYPIDISALEALYTCLPHFSELYLHSSNEILLEPEIDDEGFDAKDFLYHFPHIAITVASSDE